MKGASRKRVVGVFVMSMLLAASHVVAAETESDEATQKTKVRDLPAVTVVDKRVTQREDLKADSITNPYRVAESAQVGTQVFTEEDIKNLKARDLNDLLDKADGINVTYQGRKSPYFISQRGGGTFTYIIDGAVLPSSANRILYKIPLSSIEQLEVVRGATSLTLGPSIPIGASASGSGLNTGYIIIRTKRPQKTTATLSGSVEKSIGGHSVADKESLYAGTKIGEDCDVNGYVGALLARMDRPSQDTWFDGQDSENGMATGGLTAGKLNLNLMGYTDDGRFEMQRGVKLDGSLDTSKWYYDPLNTKVFSGDASLSWTPDQVTLLNVFGTEYEQTEFNGTFVSTKVTRSEYNEDTSGFGLRHNARFGKTLVQAAAQMSNSTGAGPNTSSSYNKYDTTVTGYAGSVEQKLFGDKLSLDGGYRYDIKHIDNSATSAAKSKANNDVDMDPSTVYAFGAHYKITDKYILDGRYYSGDQGTSGDFDMRSQTGQLHNETQDRIEIALESKLAEYFNPTVTWFSIDADNIKTSTGNTYTVGGSTYYYYTESDEDRQGVELAFKGTVLKNTTYTASWTHMYEIESVSSTGVKTDAIGWSQPEDFYTVIIGQRWGKYRANVSVKQVEGWLSTTATPGTSVTGGLGDYTRVDANVSRDFMLKKSLLNVAIFGRNLGDERYSTRYVTGYYPDRGLTYGTEVTLSY